MLDRQAERGRISSGCVPVAQLDRALASGAKGCRFKSCLGCHFYPGPSGVRPEESINTSKARVRTVPKSTLPSAGGESHPSLDCSSSARLSVRGLIPLQSRGHRFWRLHSVGKAASMPPRRKRLRNCSGGLTILRSGVRHVVPSGECRIDTRLSTICHRNR